MNSEFRDLLEKCASTAMSSKLIHSHKDFFKKLVVDAVLHLDQNDLNENLIGIKKVPGGAMQETLFVDGNLSTYNHSHTQHFSIDEMMI